ncbi:serine-threonine protein kinase, putative [Entamoeba invadens IP1]|uniref:Serine-threonine protein kinase, putative n=1 Tax=Entamoeba invadens IP1 TaxID=370355 RepID=A0A0A1TX09_ENTIV|nr:serine-threonine protein kinase, putative [Entamoeba invadens IP1]ELP85793.1 serine-threonine protein kinase, putative [Entamoeba invadens IP1]|eukprot:XP_004185139.1 serine-threonine protein kinase, putative [Entamoeba invadens IP1]
MKQDGAYTTPYLCAEFNLRPASWTTDDVYIVGFTNFGITYANDANGIGRVYFVYRDTSSVRQKTEILTATYYEWHKVCLASSDSTHVGVYVDSETQLNQSVEHATMTSSDMEYYIVLMSYPISGKPGTANVGTVSGIVYGDTLLTVEQLKSYFSNNIGPLGNKFALGTRYSGYTTQLLKMSFTKNTGNVSVLSPNFGLPMIDDGCYETAKDTLPIHSTVIPIKSVDSTTISQFNPSNAFTIENGVIRMDAEDYFLLNAVNTNNLRNLKIEIDFQGIFEIDFKYGEEWVEGIKPKSLLFTPKATYYLPYFLMGGSTDLKVKCVAPGTGETLCVLKELRVIEEKCDVYSENMFCGVDKTCGVCISSSCVAKNYCVKTFNFSNEVTLSATQLQLNSVENTDVSLVTTSLSAVKISKGNDQVLGQKVQYYRFEGTIGLIEIGDYKVPSGFGRLTNEYSLFITVKLRELSDGSFFVSSGYYQTLQTMVLSMKSSIISTASQTGTKSAQADQWMTLGIQANTTHFNVFMNGNNILSEENVTAVDYLNAKTIHLESFIHKNFDITSVQIVPFYMSDVLMNKYTAFKSLVSTTCTTPCTLPAVCFDGKCVSKFDKQCALHCNECVDGKCNSCLSNYDLTKDCSSCAEGFSGELCDTCADGYNDYPACTKKSNTGIIVGVIVAIVVIIVIIIVVIILIMVLLRYLRKHAEKVEQETELKAVENNGQSVLLKEAKKKKVVVNDETLVELGTYLYITKTKLTFNLHGEEPNIDTPLLDQVVFKNRTDRQLVIWIQCPKKDKFFLQCDVEKKIIDPNSQIQANFEIQLHCNCSCKEEINIKIETVNTHECETGNIRLAVATYNSKKIDFDEIELKNPPLGDGAFGVVYRGTYKGIEVAVKKLKDRSDNEGAKNEFMKEVSLLDKLRGPYIVSFVGACYLPTKMCIAIEFAPDGSLGHVMKKNTLTYEQKVKYMLDCSKGMTMMHTFNTIHRDLKPDNLLVFCIDQVTTRIVNCKLTDFGTSRGVQEFEENYTVGIGTPVYMAPEILDKKPYTVTVDQYSFGVMMYEVFDQTKPYKTDQFKTPWDVAKFVVEGKRLPRKEGMSEGYWEITSRCWDVDPAKRPEFKEVALLLQKELSLTVPEFAIEEGQRVDTQMSFYKNPSEKTQTSTTTTTLTNTNTTNIAYKTGDSTVSKVINTTTSEFDVN